MVNEHFPTTDLSSMSVLGDIASNAVDLKGQAVRVGGPWLSFRNTWTDRMFLIGGHMGPLFLPFQRLDDPAYGSALASLQFKPKKHAWLVYYGSQLSGLLYHWTFILSVKYTTDDRNLLLDWIELETENLNYLWSELSPKNLKYTLSFGGNVETVQAREDRICKEIETVLGRASPEYIAAFYLGMAHFFITARPSMIARLIPDARPNGVIDETSIKKYLTRLQSCSGCAEVKPDLLEKIIKTDNTDGSMLIGMLDHRYMDRLQKMSRRGVPSPSEDIPFIAVACHTSTVMAKLSNIIDRQAISSILNSPKRRHRLTNVFFHGPRFWEATGVVRPHILHIAYHKSGFMGRPPCLDLMSRYVNQDDKVSHIKGVVLDCRYPSYVAQDFAKVAGCVIHLRGRLSDSKIYTFVTALYDSIAAGDDLPTAFDLAIEFSTIVTSSKPAAIMYNRRQSDPDPSVDTEPRSNCSSVAGPDLATTFNRYWYD